MKQKGDGRDEITVKVYEVRCCGTQHVGPAPLLMIVRKPVDQPPPDLPRAMCDACAAELKRTPRPPEERSVLQRMMDKFIEDNK